MHLFPTAMWEASWLQILFFFSEETIVKHAYSISSSKQIIHQTSKKEKWELRPTNNTHYFLIVCKTENDLFLNKNIAFILAKQFFVLLLIYFINFPSENRWRMHRCVRHPGKKTKQKNNTPQMSVNEDSTFTRIVSCHLFCYKNYQRALVIWKEMTWSLKIEGFLCPIETNQLGSTQHTEYICGFFLILYTSYKSEKVNNLNLCTNKLLSEFKIQSEAIQTRVELILNLCPKLHSPLAHW